MSLSKFKGCISQIFSHVGANRNHSNGRDAYVEK